jgi:hypothetical protein
MEIYEISRADKNNKNEPEANVIKTWMSLICQTKQLFLVFPVPASFFCRFPI